MDYSTQARTARLRSHQNRRRFGPAWAGAVARVLFPAAVFLLAACATPTPSADSPASGEPVTEPVLQEGETDLTVFGLPQDPFEGVDYDDPEEVRIAWTYRVGHSMIWGLQLHGTSTDGLIFPDPRTLPLVRFVEDDLDWANAMVECLTEAGFPVVVEDRHPIAPSDAANRLNWSSHDFPLQYYTCAAAYPRSPLMLKPYGEEQLIRIFTYHVEVLAPCLEAHGFPQQQEPPSLELWLESQESGEYLWDPNVSAIPFDTPPSVLDTLREECPPLSPQEIWADN